MSRTPSLAAAKLAAAAVILAIGVFALGACASSPEPGASEGMPCNAEYQGVTDPPSLWTESHYADGIATFTVCGHADQNWDVELSTTDGVATEMTPFSITLGPSGETTFEVPITVDSSRRGSITASLDNGYPEMSNAMSLWLEPTKDGGVAQGNSQIAAQLDAIDQDYPTDEERQRAFEELGRLDADSVIVEGG